MSKKEAEVAEGEATEAKVDGRQLWVEHPEYTNGERVKRADWIRSVYSDENSPFYGKRGAIAKALTDMAGKPVPYQVVFAATKEDKAPAAAIKAAKQAAADEAAAAKEAASTEG